jgi:multicomponent Na+:H+ antiporter subunit C
MILFFLCFILLMVGLYGVLTRKNLIKIILGLSIMQYAINLFLILVGYVREGSAPILNENATIYVDPLPQAMILTVIVIGLATTALLLAMAVKLYRKHNTFNIQEIKILKG